MLRSGLAIVPSTYKFGDLVMYKTLGWMLIGNGYGPCKFLKKLYCLDGCWYIMAFL